MTAIGGVANAETDTLTTHFLTITCRRGRGDKMWRKLKVTGGNRERGEGESEKRRTGREKGERTRGEGGG